MNDEPTSFEKFCLWMCAIMFIIISILFCACCDLSDRWKADAHAHKVEAVRHGAAEWRTDEHGQVSFHWIKNRKESQP